MVFPLSKHIFIYRPLSPLMVVPLPKLIFIYQPLISLGGISSIQTYIHLPTTVYLDGISCIQTYIILPTTCLPRWYFLYLNLYSFTNHLSPLMVVPLPKLIFIYRPLSPSEVFPLFKLIFIYQPLIYLDGISSIQTYIHLPTTYLPRWYFLYSNLYSFTNHLSTSMVFPVSKLILFYQPLVYLDGISSI